MQCNVPPSALYKSSISDVHGAFLLKCGGSSMLPLPFLGYQFWICVLVHVDYNKLNRRGSTMLPFPIQNYYQY